MENAGKVNLCNLALGHLGLPIIVALTNVTSSLAVTCNQYYEQCLGYVLRQHFWKFATKRRILSPLATAPVSEFTNAFSLPSDCIRLQIFLNGEILSSDKYDINAGKILSDEATLSIKYIFYNLNTVVYTTDFDMVFSLYLAFNMSRKLKGSEDIKLFARYEEALKGAMNIDSGESRNTEIKPVLTLWERARLGGGSIDVTKH